MAYTDSSGTLVMTVRVPITSQNEQEALNVLARKVGMTVGEMMLLATREKYAFRMETIEEALEAGVMP